MTYTGPHCYILHLAGEKEHRKIIKKEKEEQVVKFQRPVTNKSQPKLYLLSKDQQIIYIGYTHQSIGARLGIGMRANGQNGYHGYKWKQKFDHVHLMVFVFDKKFSGDDQKDATYKYFVEAIEAELVYKVRQETGI